mmetsp:Transcript_112972/g.205374  ORF Transcript_112972/g.205374 Transcript_112972/m.205374 type:complete len:590 (+) Transcript_112972:30-1799(+)
MDLEHLVYIGLAPPRVCLTETAADNVLLLQTAPEFKEFEAQAQFPSCLSGWPSGSKSHPQRFDSIHIHEGRSPMPTPARCLSVVSWNVLSQSMLQKAYDDPEDCYKHLTPEYVGDADDRQCKVLKWLADLSPDLILLQEVDVSRYAEGFEAPLKALGYDGSRLARNGKITRNSIGCATFWRRDKLSCLWDSSREEPPQGSRDWQSFCLLHQFKLIGSDAPGILVSNLHLRASRDQKSQKQRAKSLDVALERLSRQLPGAPLLVAGDFNAEPNNALMAVLRESACHGFELASAYEHPDAGTTSVVQEATCAAHMETNKYIEIYDHIWYSHGRLQLCCVLQALGPEERREAFRFDGPGLPNQLVPSDHVPVGAVFEISSGDLGKTGATSGRPEGNFFLSIPVMPPGLLAGFSAVESTLQHYDSRFEGCLTDPAAAHITLWNLYLATPEEEEAAVAVLDEVARSLPSPATPSELNFDSVQTFDGRVLYFSVAPGENRDALFNLATALRDAFIQRDMFDDADQDPFEPHATVATFSRVKNKRCRKEFKHFPVELCESLQGIGAGVDRSLCVRLCRCLGREKGQYYTLRHEIHL